jgi:hypothetical protein
VLRWPVEPVELSAVEAPIGGTVEGGIEIRKAGRTSARS